EAAKIVALVNQAIDKTRELSRGLLPVLADARGLMAALERLSLEIDDLFHISCRFECEQPVLIHQSDVATHLYHIAQEAVNNAVKHGHPKHILIRLEGGERSCLSIDDDGLGMPDTWPAMPGTQGMGLQIMKYRAKMIGGSIEVRRGPDRG